MGFLRIVSVFAALLVIEVVCADRVLADDVTLVMQTTCWAPGDTVSFTLTNLRPTPIYMPNDPGWEIHDGESGLIIYPGAVFPTVVTLGGNTAATYAWGQSDRNGNLVTPGSYWAEVNYSPQFDPWMVTPVRATFRIQETCPPTGA